MSSDELDCIFCKIIRKDIPSIIIYEDSDFIVFPDINPMNKGHMLVVPKIHYETMLDMPHDVASRLLPVVQKITRAVLDATGHSKFNWYVVGEDVAHAHMHIVPRFEGDNAPVFKQGKYDSQSEMETLATRIKENLV